MLKIIAPYIPPFVAITLMTAIVIVAYQLILAAHNEIMNDKNENDEEV